MPCSSPTTAPGMLLSICNHNTSTSCAGRVSATQGWLAHPLVCMMNRTPTFCSGDGCMSGVQGMEGNHSCVSPESASTGVQPQCCMQRVSLVKRGNVFFRIDGKRRLRNASKNNCIFSMFSLWPWMKMKLEITFAFTVSTNLRNKFICSRFYGAFQINRTFCFHCYSQQNANCKGIFPQDLNLFIEICL